MKRIVFLATIIATVAVACTPSPEDVKEECLKDKNNERFYGEQTPAYCDCVYEKVKEIADSTKLSRKIIDSVKAECDAQYTSLDTNF